MQNRDSKSKENQVRAVASQPSVEMSRSEISFPFVDNRPEAAQLKRLQEMADDSPQSKNAARLQAMINNSSSMVAQQQQIERMFGRTAQRQQASEEDGPLSDLELRLDQIEERYLDMITAAREDGYNVAADNLQRFLHGIGGTKPLEVPWLRGFSVVTSAERENQGSFERVLTDLADELADGETTQFSDNWHSMFTGSGFTELYYAVGTSTIGSYGNFTLARNGELITIQGTVKHHWYDTYDWHAKWTTYIPGFGTISDEDALLLQQHRGAYKFEMEADWTQTVRGSIEIVDWWFDSVDYVWSGP